MSSAPSQRDSRRFPQPQPPRWSPAAHSVSALGGLVGLWLHVTPRLRKGAPSGPAASLFPFPPASPLLHGCPLFAPSATWIPAGFHLASLPCVLPSSSGVSCATCEPNQNRPGSSLQICSEARSPTRVLTRFPEASGPWPSPHSASPPPWLLHSLLLSLATGSLVPTPPAALCPTDLREAWLTWPPVLSPLTWPCCLHNTSVAGTHSEQL